MRTITAIMEKGAIDLTDNVQKGKYYVCNLSGGKDSTAMFLELLRRKYPLDECVCCDTGMEFPAMYRHIEKLRKVAEQNGIKFTVIKSEKSFEYYMFDHVPKRNNGRTHAGFSWPGPLQRWCTSKLKQEVIDRYTRELRKTHDVYHYIGIAWDEDKRLQRKEALEPHKLYPLVEWGMTEADCLQCCYDRGYDWEGLYEIFKRVSCWCCPLQALEELRKLRKHFPELWERLKDMDNRTWRTFKPNCSVEDLEARFRLEEEFEAKGMSTSARNKLFREELDKRLGRDKESQTT